MKERLNDYNTAAIELHTLIKRRWNDYDTAATELNTLISVDPDQLSIHEIDTILTLIEDCFSAVRMLNYTTCIYEESYEFYAGLRESKLSAAEAYNEVREEFWSAFNLYY